MHAAAVILRELCKTQSCFLFCYLQVSYYNDMNMMKCVYVLCFFPKRHNQTMHIFYIPAIKSARSLGPQNSSIGQFHVKQEHRVNISALSASVNV